MRVNIHITAMVICLSLLGVARADERPTVLVVVGAEGTEDFGKQFRQWHDRWQKAVAGGEAAFFSIGIEPQGKQSDRELLQQTLSKSSGASSEALWLVLIGHGTFNGKTARFNLRGPDVSAAELAEWMAPLERPIAVVNCTSASAPFLQSLSGENRVIVTATKSGQEHNFARFGDYVSAAMSDPQADLDKDDQTSLLEAFILAAAGVAEFYASEARLATEHPLIDDNGDKLGTPADWFRGLRATKGAKDGAALDGLRASQFHLVRSQRERQLPAEARAERDTLEQQLAALREQKATLGEDDYYRQIEVILLALARLYEQNEQHSDAPADATPPPPKADGQ
jgi:hypothetical protein